MTKHYKQTKHPISSFIYCPLCRSELQVTGYDHRQRKVCPECGFVDFHNPAPAAGAMIVQDGRLLLVKRAQDPYKDDWCIPAGFMEWNESPRRCAEREIEEETGLLIKAGELFEVYSGTDDPRTNAILVLFLCEVTGGTLKAGDDAAAACFFSKAEIPQNIAFAAHLQAIADFKQRFPDLLR